MIKFPCDANASLECVAANGGYLSIHYGPWCIADNSYHTATPKRQVKYLQKPTNFLNLALFCGLGLMCPCNPTRVPISPLWIIVRVCEATKYRQGSSCYTTTASKPPSGSPRFNRHNIISLQQTAIEVTSFRLPISPHSNTRPGQKACTVGF